MRSWASHCCQRTCPQAHSHCASAPALQGALCSCCVHALLTLCSCCATLCLQVRFALTYPEIYEVGASNLGHIILYGILNQQDGLLCDRAYFPGGRNISVIFGPREKWFALLL